jgi:predicted transcriptional regulator
MKIDEVLDIIADGRVSASERLVLILLTANPDGMGTSDLMTAMGDCPRRTVQRITDRLLESGLVEHEYRRNAMVRQGAPARSVFSIRQKRAYPQIKTPYRGEYFTNAET